MEVYKNDAFSLGINGAIFPIVCRRFLNNICPFHIDIIYAFSVQSVLGHALNT